MRGWCEAEEATHATLTLLLRQQQGSQCRETLMCNSSTSSVLQVLECVIGRARVVHRGSSPGEVDLPAGRAPLAGHPLVVPFQPGKAAQEGNSL